jgi:dTDP-4-dehydrorhamnose 3,5-epimerase
VILSEKDKANSMLSELDLSKYPDYNIWFK